MTNNVFQPNVDQTATIDWEILAEDIAMCEQHILTKEEEKRFALNEKNYRKKLKRIKRLKDCGNFAYYFDPHTGKRTSFIMYCDLFRECPTCLQRRADREFGWMKIASSHKEITVEWMSGKKEITNHLRGMDKTKYARFPMEGDIELVFIDKELNPDGDVVDINWVARQDWTSIVLTPERRNKSGTIHVPVSPEEEEEFSIISTKQLVTEAPVNEIEETADGVVENTQWMKPKTAKEVAVFLNKRSEMTVARLRQMGYDVRVYSKQLKVIHSRIDWSGEKIPDFSVNADFSDINLTVNTEKTTLQQELPMLREAISDG